jgi:gamma-glutamylcyclotransferase (GGCT)/AIG2-like uncharacterized protein YtfP
VYGTLRPGEPNWDRLLAGRADQVVTGHLAGVVLLDCGHFPAALERPGAGGAFGDVVWIRPAAWSAVLVALDHLEGYDPADPNRLYDRVVRSVETAHGPVDCWVYLAGRSLADSEKPVVTAEDWLTHCRDVPGYRQHWDSIAEAGGRAQTDPSGQRGPSEAPIQDL